MKPTLVERMYAPQRLAAKRKDASLRGTIQARNPQRQQRVVKDELRRDKHGPDKN